MELHRCLSHHLTEVMSTRLRGFVSVVKFEEISSNVLHKVVVFFFKYNLKKGKVKVNQLHCHFNIRKDDQS